MAKLRGGSQVSGDLTIEGILHAAGLDVGNIVGASTQQYVVDDSTTNATYYPLVATTSATGNKDIKISSSKLAYNPSTGVLSATQLKSTVANGTAPLIVTSTTKIDNLNADLLDGQHGSYYAPKANPTFTGTFQVRNSADTATHLTVNNTSGATIVSGGGDVSLSAGAGQLLIGNPDAVHIAIDNNDIQSKANGTTSSILYLNDYGGDVSLCGNVNDALKVKGHAKTLQIGNGVGQNILKLYNSDLDSNLASRIEFRLTDGQHVQIRHNSHDSVRPPFGLHIEKTADNTQTTMKAYLDVEGKIYSEGGTVWHSGNDGSGSGLDADLLDGYHADTAATANTLITRDSSGRAKVAAPAASGDIARIDDVGFSPSAGNKGALLYACPQFDDISGTDYYSRLAKLRVNRSGTYVCRINLSCTNGRVYARIYKNGVAYGDEHSTSSSTFTTYDDTLSFSAGDYIELWAKSSTSSVSTSARLYIYVDSNTINVPLVVALPSDAW